MTYLLIGIIGLLLGMHFVNLKYYAYLEDKLFNINRRLNELSNRLPDKADENQLDKAAQ